MEKVKTFFKNFFITGLLALVPLVVTLWVFTSLIRWFDRLFPFEKWFGFDIPGLGLVLSIVAILLTGFTVRSLVGTWTAELFRQVLVSIPVVGGVYASLRQLLETFVSKQGTKLGATVLVPFPHENSWTIGFVTSQHIPREIAQHLKDGVCVFVPATPMPGSGFLLFVESSRIRPLNMPVEQGLKTVVSLGLAGKGEIRTSS